MNVAKMRAAAIYYFSLDNTVASSLSAFLVGTAVGLVMKLEFAR